MRQLLVILATPLVAVAVAAHVVEFEKHTLDIDEADKVEEFELTDWNGDDWVDVVTRKSTATNVMQVYVQKDPVSAGLVAHYKLDGNALDSSGNGYHGKDHLYGYERLTNGGVAAKFDGGHWIEAKLESGNWVFGQDAFAVAFWAKTTRWLGPGDYEVPISTSACSSDQDYQGWYVTLGYDDHVRLVGYHNLDNSADEVVSEIWGGDFTPIDEWHHYVFQRNDDDSPHIFIDGVDVTRSGAAAWTRNIASTCPLTIGKFYRGENPFSGLLDDVRIYDRELSQHEIEQIVEIERRSRP